MLKKGVLQPLEPEHIWDLPSFDKIETIVQEYDTIVKNEFNSLNKEFSLFKILFKQNKKIIWPVIANTLFSSALSLLLPYFIRYLSLFYEDTLQPLYIGISLACGLLLSMSIRILHNSYAWTLMSRLMFRCVLFLATAFLKAML